MLDFVHTRYFRLVRYLWPLLVALAVFVTMIDTMLDGIIALNGQLIYTLDDTYIHMAVAKNFATVGTWGVTPYQFSSSSSSPLWTLTLAFFFWLSGVEEGLPFALNLLAGILFLFSLNALLHRAQTPSPYRAALMVFLLYALRLDALISLGMEHMPHLALSVLFLAYSAHLLSRPRLSYFFSKRMLLLYGVGVLVGTVRYEGLFLVLAVCVLFALRLGLLHGFFLGFFAISPTLIYGGVAIRAGWPFFPTSLLLKSDRFVPKNASMVYARLYDNLRFSPMLWGLALALAGVVLYNLYRRPRFFHRGVIAPLATLGALLLHIFFVNSDTVFMRYSAYIVGTSLFALVYATGDWLPQSPRRKDLLAVLVLAVLGALILKPLYDRHLEMQARDSIVLASGNIYQQQYQMGLFVKQYYSRRNVAIQDIGAVNFLSDANSFDIWGLGNYEVAAMRLEDDYDVEDVKQIVFDRRCEIAIVYHRWLENYTYGVPENWVAVGTWTVFNPVVLGDTSVTFYATTPRAVRYLIASLQDFSERLPPDYIDQEGWYMQVSLEEHQ